MEQQLCLETPGWRTLDFNGNPLPDEIVDQQRARITRTKLLRRDRVYPFCEDLITNDAGVVDPQLPILVTVSSLLEAVQRDGSYEFVQQLWAQFSLTPSCVNIEVVWSRNEVLVNIRIFYVSYTYFVPEN